MDFELDQQQRDFQRTMREFVDREIKPVASAMERSGEYPTAIVDQMKELGLFGMTIPTEYGGLDLDAVSFAIVFEELSRGWMGIAGTLGTHSLSCWMIAQFGTEDQKDRYLPELATGVRRTGDFFSKPTNPCQLRCRSFLFEAFT